MPAGATPAVPPRRQGPEGTHHGIRQPGLEHRRNGRDRRAPDRKPEGAEDFVEQFHRDARQWHETHLIDIQLVKVGQLPLKIERHPFALAHDRLVDQPRSGYDARRRVLPAVQTCLRPGRSCRPKGTHASKLKDITLGHYARSRCTAIGPMKVPSLGYSTSSPFDSLAATSSAITAPTAYSRGLSPETL